MVSNLTEYYEFVMSLSSEKLNNAIEYFLDQPHEVADSYLPTLILVKQYRNIIEE